MRPHLARPSLERPIAASFPGRTGSGWRGALATPAESLHTYLTPGEEVLLVDAPALNAFIVDELPIVLVTLALSTAAVVWSLGSGNLFVGGIALVIGGGLLLHLQAKRFVERYTAYVLTNNRVMRVSGFVRRSAAWIPWVKVTDVRFEATLMGRLLGYATVYIDSANETSGLSEMRNLRDPASFYLMLTELVQRQQGSLPAQDSAALFE